MKHASHYLSHAAAEEGFTLLEIVVALSVILAALVGPVALITRGLFDFSNIKNKLVALNLAQEGIEVVRAVRENNIICQSVDPNRNWLTDSDNTGRLTNPPALRKVSAIATDTFTCGSSTITNPKTDVGGNCATDFLKIDSMTGNYGYAVGADSLFTRCVTITSPVGGAEDGIPANQMADVVSTVNWQEHGFTRTVTLRERMYRWRYPISP